MWLLVRRGEEIRKKCHKGGHFLHEVSHGGRGGLPSRTKVTEKDVATTFFWYRSISFFEGKDSRKKCNYNTHTHTHTLWTVVRLWVWNNRQPYSLNNNRNRGTNWGNIFFTPLSLGSNIHINISLNHHRQPKRCIFSSFGYKENVNSDRPIIVLGKRGFGLKF